MNNKEIEQTDYIILPSSIICHETEIESLKKLSEKGKKIFVIGIFANVIKSKYQTENSYIVQGDPKLFFQNKFKQRRNRQFFFFIRKKSNNCSQSISRKFRRAPISKLGLLFKKYPLKNNFLDFNSKIAIPITATRGCPYSCFNYCTYPLQQGRKVRFRSVKNVVQEMQHWINTLKTNKFIFRDPVFSINRKYTVDLCKEIINSKIKISYLIETHLKNLDDELISLLKQSGLKLVYVGIESSNSSVLKDINRFTVNNDDQYKIIKKLVDNGIYVKSMFMLGNPEDSEDTIKDTIDYSLKLPHQLVQYSVFTPYPGTPIYSLYKDKIIEEKFERFNQYNLIFKHKNLDNDKITKLKNFAYKKFYLRSKNFPVIMKSFLSLVT